MSASDQSLDSGIAVALLAAGSARRAGGAKLGRDLGGRPLALWAAEAAEQAGFRNLFIVVADASAPDFGLLARGWTRVVNAEAGTGMASSIRAAGAAAAAHGFGRLVLALADMPFVSAAHLRALGLGAGVVFTRYPSGRQGVPAGFDRAAFGKLKTLRGDAGAASLEWSAATAMSPSSEVELIDIDTSQDLDDARAMLARR